jgi:hypothetical protein
MSKPVQERYYAWSRYANDWQQRGAMDGYETRRMAEDAIRSFRRADDQFPETRGAQYVITHSTVVWRSHRNAKT